MTLYNLTGAYEKTITLYDFTKNENGFYSFGNLLKNGQIALEDAFVLGDALTQVGRNKDALLLYFPAILFYEKERDSINSLAIEEKQQWFSNIIPNYKKAASFSLTQDEDMYKPLAAFYAIELCKARTLTEQYGELIALYNGGLTDEEIFKLTDYKIKISRFRDKIAMTNSLNVKLNLRMVRFAEINKQYEYNQQLLNKYPKYKEILTDLMTVKDLKTEQMKNITSPDNCYISYSVVKKNSDSDEILELVFDENGEVKGIKISVEDNFFDSCNIYRELLSYSNIENMKRDSKYLWKLPNGGYKIMTTRQSPTPNAILVNNSKDLADIRQELSTQIGNTLLAPLSQYISSKSNWIISPDDELNNIPFETLQYNGKMAIESADISYVPSFAVLALMKEMGEKNSKLQNRKELFAMGNAVYGNNDYAESRGLQIEFLEDIKRGSDDYVDLTKLKWANLPGTGEELKNVAALFSADKQEIITDIDASEKNLKQRDKDGQLSQYKYLLFATHGLFMPTKLEYSSIVLSQGLADENYDGYVTIVEWFDYKLNSDLVYLSACESGLGDYQAGEGIIGLPYALTVAGNKDTVISLWKIDDEAAAKFASVFFRKLKEGKTEVQALNETKREFLSDPNPKFNSPSAWAAFLLYGI